MKTPEEMAEEYRAFWESVKDSGWSDQTICYEAFSKGFRARDEEIAMLNCKIEELEKQIFNLKEYQKADSELREGELQEAKEQGAREERERIKEEAFRHFNDGHFPHNQKRLYLHEVLKFISPMESQK
jgi:hypothetical protein